MSAPQNDPQNSSSGSTWLTVALAILVLIVLACGGLCGGCIYVGRQAANQVGKQFEQIAENLPLLEAMNAAQVAAISNPQVVDRLGEPVTMASLPGRQGTGPLKPAGETIQFDLSGPKGKAIVSAVAIANGANYRVVKITVTFEDGSVVDVEPLENPSSTNELPPAAEEPGAIPIDPELNAPIEAK